jgi:hypothetical protein
MRGHNNKKVFEKAILLLSALALMCLCFSCFYMKMNPPPDINKVDYGHNTEDTKTCWLATAANMLAGAGYGNGNTVQKRADDIYKQLVAENTEPNGNIFSGWTDKAIEWWIWDSGHNNWPENPYRYVDIKGYTDIKPWDEPEGPNIIANLLRDCRFVGISLGWPPKWGHAIAAWGDEIGGIRTPYLNLDPETLRATDSEWYFEELVQAYTYDDYENPNPEGTNFGDGWYLDYFPEFPDLTEPLPHPFIKHIIILEPVDKVVGQDTIIKVVGSYKIHQTNALNATDLHYKIHSEAEILSYNTIITSSTENPPSIIESQPERKKLDVTWDLSDDPVPECRWMTITTELILPEEAPMEYDDVHFTYQAAANLGPFPYLWWKIQTQPLENAEAIPNVKGGYVIGSFDILEGMEHVPGQEPIAKFRFIRRYPYSRSPNDHTFILKGKEGFRIENVRFGHNYGILDEKELWEFKDWNTEISPDVYPIGKDPIKIPIVWTEKLTYPIGETSTGKIPKFK